MKNFTLLKKFFDPSNPTKVLLNMYLAVILIGTILLIMPWANANHAFTPLSDSFFTAVSAVCVTGLSTVTTVTHWSFFGQLVIVILIQLGGLGVMTAAASVGLILNRRFSIAQRMNLAEEKNVLTVEGVVKLLKYIFSATFLIEFIGVILLSFTFVPEFGFTKGIWYSIFHSISAFCNAGFDLIGASSLAPYAGNFFFLSSIMLLIVFGGLGFLVIQDILAHKTNFRRYALHTKIVVSMTLILILVPTVGILWIEWTNSNTIGSFSFGSKFLGALFQSVTPRTAGFSALDQALLRPSTGMIVLVLMFIGGAPGGTAGGMKITTITTIFLIVKAMIKNEKDVTIYQRRLPEDIGRKAIAIFMISITWIMLVIFMLSISETGQSFTDLVFEVVSAYGTVGLSRGITGDLSTIGRILISATMIFGKIGPLAIVFAFTKKTFPKAYREAEESIIVG